METKATESGTASSPELSVTLQKGRKISLEIVSPQGTEVPADLQPQIIPKPFIGSSWSGRSLDNAGALVNIAPGEVGSDGKLEFNVADDTPPLYLIIDHPGFLRGWQADEPLATTGTSARVELPKPASVDVTFGNPYADMIPADAVPTLKVSTSRKIPGSGSWLIEAATYKNSPGVREWKLRDLAPGNYYFAASEGPVESRQSTGRDYAADTSGTVALSAHTVIPPVVALDESGTTISKAEGRVQSSNKRSSSHGWTKAEDGLITFRREGLSGRYAGDDVINDFTVEVRAPGLAASSSQLKAGAPTLPPFPVTLKPGRKITVTITSEDGRAVPIDLQPVVLGKEHFPGSLNYLWQPERAPALALPKHVTGNQWEFNISEDTESFRIALKDGDFLGSYWSEEYTDISQSAIDLKLPAPGGLKVDVKLTSPPLAGKDAEDDQKYYYSLNRLAGSAGSNLSVSIDSASIYESTSTVTSNLPPGEYELSVRPRGAYIDSSKVSVKIESGTTATTSITAEPADPNVDPFGRKAPKFPKVKITDDSGKVIPDARIIVQKKSSRYIPTLKWHLAGTDGWIAPRLDPSPDSPDGEYDVLVRAPGYPLTVETITLPTSATEIVAKAKSGKEVTLNLKAETGNLPEGLVPSVFPERWGQPVWLSTQESREKVYAPETLLSPTALRPVGAGQYALSVDAESTEPLYMLVHHPNFLKGFQAGPFDPAEWVTSGTVDILLPKPATLSGLFDAAGETLNSPVVTMQIYRSQKVPGANSWSLSVEQDELPATSAALVATDLAPGSYSVKAAAASANALYGENTYSTSGKATLDAGESETVALKYRPFKKEWLEGPNTALIKILNQTGQPAKGQAYKVTWYESGYPQQTVAEGMVPDDGVVKVENLAGVDRSVTSEEMKERGGVPSFTVMAGDSRLGDVGFFEYREGKFHPLAAGKTTKEFEFRIPPSVGDMAPDIAMVDLVTSETVNLKDFHGQVVLIDFWATWCGPYQGPGREPGYYAKACRGLEGKSCNSGR